MKWLPILVFALFGYYLIGANFSAKLGMIDDHEIPKFLGSDGKIEIWEIPKVIGSTEVGRWGEYPRFRPSYFSLRVIETALWRDAAVWWYLTRYLMLIASMYLGWKIASRFFPKLISYLIVFYLMTLPFWPDLLTRLGPSEIYALPGLLMFIWGIMSGELWLVAAGYAVCVGAKENLLVLFPLLLLYAWYRYFTKKITVKEGVMYAALTLYTAWIVGAIAAATGQTGADVYGTAISYPARLSRLYQYKRYIVESRHLQIPIFIMLAATLKIGAEIIHGKWKKAIKSPELKHLAVGILLGSVILSQYIFYDSKLPSNMRYDFPVMLLFPVFMLTALSLALTLLPKRKLSKLVKRLVYVGLFFGLGYLVLTRGYGFIRESAKRNAKATIQFAQNLEIVKAKLKSSPETPLVFVSKDYFDYEPMVAIERYLTAVQVTNEFKLSYSKMEGVNEPLGLELEKRLTGVMAGVPDPDGVFSRFSPTGEIKPPCWMIAFDEGATYGKCELLATF